MKIRLKNTKLVDEKKGPLSFFHVTPCERFARFFPLSHFGTKSAAQMRSMHFIYQTLNIPEPAVLPSQIPVQLLNKYAQRKGVPKFLMYSVYLAMKSPVRMTDLSSHSLERYYHWFSRCYAPKAHFLTGSERCEGDVVGAARTKYKGVLSDFIFRDPFTRSEEDLKKELSVDTLYSVPKKIEKPECVPAFLFPVMSKMDKKLYSLAEKVAFQRMIRYLEKEGHDGFVYQNEYEDKGQNSYIIFRPEQVFDLSEKSGEHVVFEGTTEQKTFLRDLELKFFNAHGMLSPIQRVENHLQNLKKNKVRKSR